MAFGLLQNLYKHLQSKWEKKLTLVCLGLDNAGKTTTINTLNGLLEEEATPTFGFQAQHLTEGRFKVEIFDLGGSKNVRRIWKAYFSEVHAVIYVVDATDRERFGEARAVLEEALAQAHLEGKPVLVFANKQDLATVAPAAEVAVALGLDGRPGNRFNIVGCTARVAEGKQPDARLRDGFLWAISQVNAVYTSLDARVKAESAVVKAEEAAKKKEREERGRAAKEERYRRQAEQEAAEAVAGPVPASASAPMISALLSSTPEPEPEPQSMRPNPMVAVGLPNQIESPKRPGPAEPALLLAATGSPMGERLFSDPFSDTANVAGVSGGAAAASRRPPLPLDDSVGSSGPRDLRPATGGSVGRVGSASRMSRQGSRPGSAVPAALAPAAVSSPAVLQDELPERPAIGGHRSVGAEPSMSGLAEPASLPTARDPAPEPYSRPPAKSAKDADDSAGWSGLAEPAPAPAGLPPVATARPGSGLAGGTEDPVSTPSAKDAPDAPNGHGGHGSPVSTLTPGQASSNQVVPVA
ncbi:hypothetical protein FOA52_003263 [Chlamydomonas sp. UWO 241]|nr:hypothetical protein FOA52_003263 [Chlamydomonas sp. UWO 241]